MIYFFSPSVLDQSANTEETPEGEEHPPADSENKYEFSCFIYSCYKLQESIGDLGFVESTI